MIHQRNSKATERLLSVSQQSERRPGPGRRTPAAKSAREDCSLRLVGDCPRELRVQADDMARLGNRRQPLADGCPVLALILAEEDLAIGRTSEQRIPARIRVQRHRLDVRARFEWKATLQVLPILARVTAACYSWIGRVGGTPLAGIQ